ncbi:RNA polymerase sigma factor [Pseudochryseolinea flava]|uniref:RNA polymerase sigma factor n=1 Tax=Pseudochryseolinea flava TaxID=2059302 RepID=UPI001FE80F53|nr:RNA polymerase sigma factor [Pseudochryseolinea flava]
MKTLRPELEALSDNALMVKVRDGDVDKLGLLFERYKRPLYGFFYGMNKDAELSEDLVQNVFVRILKYRYLFRGDGDFRTWMFHIARNVNHDHFRKNKINAKDSLESWEERLGSTENRSTQFQAEEEMQLLSMAMDQLPDDKREILLLSKYQEKKYKEIGEMLGCTESAVKVKVFRALQELKEVYRKLEAKY